MFRNPEDKPETIHTVNVLLQDGGMGDLLAALPVVAYIKTYCTWINPLVWVPDYMLEFSKHVLPLGTIVRGFSEAPRKFNRHNKGISTKWASQHTPMRTHPTLYSANMLIDGNLPKAYQNYLSIASEEIDIKRFNVPDKAVAISIGASNKAKELPVEVLNQIISYVKKKGYTPVLLGKTEAKTGAGPTLTATIVPVNKEGCIDLTDQTSLLESAAIIDKSCFLIGMDGGLIHLGGFTDTSIIAGYSFVDPAIMMPIRYGEIGWEVYPVVPDKNLGCKFCQSNIPLLYDHDFRDCYYSDYLCVQQLTFKKFKEQIERVLDEK